MNQCLILAHKGDGFTSKELCETAGINPALLSKYLKSPVVRAAVESTGLSYVPGKGRALSQFVRWSPEAIAAE